MHFSECTLKNTTLIFNFLARFSFQRITDDKKKSNATVKYLYQCNFNDIQMISQ